MAEKKDDLKKEPIEFFHSRTGGKILPDDDEDSEDEEYPDWLQERNELGIKSSNDISPGQKEAMILWNKHFMQTQYKIIIGKPKDNSEALHKYIDQNKAAIIELNIVNDTILQLSALYKCRIIDQESLFELQLKVLQPEPDPEVKNL